MVEADILKLIIHGVHKNYSTGVQLADYEIRVGGFTTKSTVQIGAIAVIDLPGIIVRQS